MNLIVCVLNKNDGKNLDTIKLKLKKISKIYKVVLIDGDSQDQSHNIAKEIGIEIYNFKTLSRGESISECIKLFQQNYDYIIFTSSDGEEDIEDIFKFEKYFKRGGDLVIASRLLDGGYFKSDKNFFYIHRKIFLKFITFSINKIFKGKLTDCWNGFRGFKLKCFEKIKIEEKDYLVEAETTIKFLKNQHSIYEFPTKENPRLYGKSSNTIFKSGFGHLILIIKNIFN